VRTVVVARGWRYTISPDAVVPAAGRPSAVAFAAVVDECTQRPPETSVTISTTLAGLTPRATDGLVGFAAIPGAVFGQLATQAYTIPFEISGDRYVTVRRQAVIGPQAAFPQGFAPLDLGSIELHSRPVVIRGRVTDAGGVTPTPVAGATVRVTGIWRTVPPAALLPPAAAPNLVSLGPSVYFDRTAAVGVMRRREMVPVAGDARTLLEQARASTRTLRVSNRTGLAAGSILRVDSPADLTEFMTVQSIAGGSTADQPATITLTYPLRHDHAPDAEVLQVTPQAPGSDIALQVDASEGDVCVLHTAMGAIAPAAVVEIHGGPQPEEYHLVSRFETISDANGFYRLPPLSRVAQVELVATDGVHLPVTRPFAPAYGLLENRVDFTFV
jgi:hypothetical protein